MPARIVLACWSSFVAVYPYPALGLALGLRARGHDPVIATIAQYRDLIESQGIGFRPLRPYVPADDYALIARVMDAKRGPRVIFRELLLPAIRDQYEDLRRAAEGADLLLPHPATPAATKSSAFDPPVLPRNRALVHLMRTAPWSAKFFFGAARRLVRGWRDPIRALRAELGLSPGRNPIFEE